ncbi:hypothetical protein WOLCODRAFT_164715 [Wolfiporia cocos MD-104 SS10]|uniref:Uncharacterized protein n=1 Tax=Wolfiporia cocos (strain MD-104) TaxID=742152 RepID=A0A2H3K5S0_WOLCO|nr:hypothetical protein WOLCODRAFT_164715 [Wolfiporia cocos MD-104 SS10]
MDKAKLRVVSLPLPILEESSFLSDTSGPSGGCARFADKEENIRIRVQSHGAELSHTPSPPSSPESVVIIAHKNELADGFLRNTHDEGSPSVHSDDAGWISWAKSPPRPIPALHGPLSLPYARCPSGAEGTIIEEQENLPRMIWGLEGEETSSHPRSETITQVPSNQTLPRSAPTAGYHSVPPRLQKARSEAVPNLTSRLEKMIRQDVGRARTNNNKSQAPHNQPRQEVVGYPLRGQEPIDLADILRNESEGHSGGLYLDYGLPNTLGHGAIHHDLLGYGLQDQSGTNWSAALLTPDLVRDVGLLPAATSLDSDLNSQVHSAMSSPSVSSLRYMLGSSHSPLIVDSPGRLSHSSQNVSLPRRMSALEIAQQYRQQLLMQQKLPFQATLPTPPSSSSPIWSANFSPYQDSVISPELLPVSGHSRYPPAGLQPQHLRLHADPDPIAQRTPQDKHNSLGIPSRKSEISSLAPAAHILNNSGEPRFGDLPLRGTPTMASLINKLERQTIRNPQLQSQVQRPPVRARPSSAASLVPLYTHDASASTAAPRAPATQVPSSPTSPKQRSRSITHQQARSIPLTRLIQRRLSSVPEEDVSVPSEKDQPRSPATQKQYRARSQSTGDPAKSSQVHFLLSSPNPLSDDPRASSPAQTTFLPQSTSPEGDTASDALLTSQPAQATVKLPGASGKELGTNVERVLTDHKEDPTTTIEVVDRSEAREDDEAGVMMEAPGLSTVLSESMADWS